jgi:hypothetical protein
VAFWKEKKGRLCSTTDSFFFVPKGLYGKVLSRFGLAKKLLDKQKEQNK